MHSKGSAERQFGEMWQQHCSTQFLEDHMAIAARLTQVRPLLPARPPSVLGGAMHQAQPGQPEISLHYTLRAGLTHADAAGRGSTCRLAWSTWCSST